MTTDTNHLPPFFYRQYGGNVKMRMKGTGKLTRTFHIDVTTKAKRLCANDENRTNLLVKNEGAAAVYITSAKNLSYTDGIELEDGDSYRNNSTTAEMWILTAASTATVKVQVDGD